MRSLLAVLLLTYPLFANGETWFTASLLSYHFERDRQYCETNPGVGIEHGERFRLVAGTYHNSLCQTSNYAGVSFAAVKYGNFSLGTAALGITGYEKTKRGTEAVWALLPVAAYEGRRWGVNLVFIPPYDDFRGAVGLQAKVRF